MKAGNVMSARSIHATTTTTTTGTRGRSRLAAAAAGVAGTAVLALAVSAVAPMAAMASTQAKSAPLTNCTAVPSSCGFPDATNTGVPNGMTLKTVPGQVSSGTGWKYNATSQEVDVTGNNAVLSGLYIPYLVNITASNVTINDDQIANAGYFGVSLRHTTGVTVENSTISGTNATTGEVGSAICDLYGDSTGMTIENDNISYFKTAVQISTGLVTGNYIHNPGYVSGDHTNGILDVGTSQALMISHNTILDNLGQTDAVSLDATGSGQPAVANKTVKNNLLGGGSYTIYGGDSDGNAISNIVIQGNVFSQAYYAKSGQYGPAAYFSQTLGTGNTWTGNTWDTTGQAIPAP
jgi:hypothetical protein